jgi:hypothetical protein
MEITADRCERTASGSVKVKRKYLARFYRIPWWIAILFTVGCVFFTLASAMSYGTISDSKYMEILHINVAGASCFLLGGILGLIDTLINLSCFQVSVTVQSNKVQALDDTSESSAESGPAKPEPIDCWYSHLYCLYSRSM